MSILLKALKKAEESKAEKETVRKAHAYQVANKKALVIILAGLVGLVLLLAIGIYWFKGRPASKLPVKITDKIAAIQSKPSAISHQSSSHVTEGPDVGKLHEDAIKQLKGKNYSGAEGILRKALLTKPDDAVMHNHLGLALKNQGKYREASSAYERALQLKPDYYEAMNNLAVTYEMLGDKEKAKTFYGKALSIKPSYAEAHLNYALLLEAEGNISKAVSHYHTFLNLSSDEGLKDKVKKRLKALRK